MKAIYFIIGLFLFTNLLVSCECIHDNDDDFCYEFDRRQCNGDEWAEIVPIDDTKSEQEKKMKNFLEDQGIEIEEVNLVENFHEAVCEACFICPTGSRFFIRIENEADVSKLEAMDLLSFGETDCSDL